MPLFNAADTIAVKSFEKGMDRESPRTLVGDGGYDDGQNILLSDPSTGGKHIVGMPIDSLLTDQDVWPLGNPLWLAPFTYSTYDAVNQELDFSTHLLIARDTGQYHRYDATSPSPTITNVRRGPNPVNRLITHWTYDKWLCVADGRNPPMKYGQHFLWQGQLEPRPYLFPLGSRPFTPLVDTPVAGESWAHDPGNGFVVDSLVPLGSRVGTASLIMSPGSQSLLTFTTPPSPLDFIAGPLPYGGDDFTATDFIVCSFIGQNPGPLPPGDNFEIRVESDPSNYVAYFFNIQGLTNTEWVTVSTAYSGSVTGAPSFSNVTALRFISHASANIYVDDFYILYRNAPPAINVGTSHKNRIVGGGAPVGSTPGEPFLSNLVWSDAGHPDNWPTANVQPMSGGFNSLARTNLITCLREYIDTVIVGTPQAIFSWTVGDVGNPVKSTLSTEHGIDAQRGVVETPSGSLIFPWQHGLYILRSTGRQYIGAKIAPLLKDVFEDAPQWWMSVVDEKTKSVRICYRIGDTDPNQNTNGLVFDYVRSQDTGEPIYTGSQTQVFDYAVPAYINGERLTLYTQNGKPQIFVLGTEPVNDPTAALQSYVTLPWMALDKKIFLTHWVGVQIPYASPNDVFVDARYASNPGEFDSAVFTQTDVLPANPTETTQGRVMLGSTHRWAQVRIRTEKPGFEIYPPVEVLTIQHTSKREP